MKYVTHVYDDNGKKVAEVAKCDHESQWQWYEVFAGLIIAAVLATQIF